MSRDKRKIITSIVLRIGLAVLLGVWVFSSECLPSKWHFSRCEIRTQTDSVIFALAIGIFLLSIVPLVFALFSDYKTRKSLAMKLGKTYNVPSVHSLHFLYMNLFTLIPIPLVFGYSGARAYIFQQSNTSWDGFDFYAISLVSAVSIFILVLIAKIIIRIKMQS